MRQVTATNMGQVTPSPNTNAIQIDHQIDWRNHSLVTHATRGGETYYLSGGQSYSLMGEEFVPATPPMGVRFKHDLMRVAIKILPMAMTLGFFMASVFLMAPILLPGIMDIWVMGFAAFTTTMHWVLSSIIVVAAGILMYGILTKARANATTHAPKSAHATPLIIVRAKFNGDTSISERVNNALRIMATDTRTAAVLALQYRDPVMILYCADRDPKRIDRDKAHNLYHKFGTAYANTIFAAETWEEYNAYCDAIGPVITDKVMIDEHAKPGQRGGIETNLTRMWGSVIALLLLALPMSAQNCEIELSRYLGEYRASTERPTGEVRFVFLSGALSRVADGSLPWVEVLRNNPAYSKSDIGQLRMIKIEGKGTVPNAADYAAMQQDRSPAPSPTTTTRPTSYDPVRPRPLFDNQPPPAQGFSLPDSSTMAENMRRWRESGDRISEGLSQNASPIWDTMMYFFWKIWVGLWLSGGLCWYVAAFAGKESGIDASGFWLIGGYLVALQQFAAGLLFLHVMLIGVVYLINSWLSIMWWPMHEVLRVILFALNLYVTYYISQRVVPNLRIISNRSMRR